MPHIRNRAAVKYPALRTAHTPGINGVLKARVVMPDARRSCNVHAA